MIKVVRPVARTAGSCSGHKTVQQRCWFGNIYAYQLSEKSAGQFRKVNIQNLHPKVARLKRFHKAEVL